MRRLRGWAMAGVLLAVLAPLVLPVRAAFSGITVFTPPDASVRLGEITAGPDGNLWAIENNENGVVAKIGKVTPGGMFTEYPVPTVTMPDVKAYQVTVSAIATGRDGAIWFTEPVANQIGRITPAGALVEFPLPTANSRARALTAGPDGAMWFLEEIGQSGQNVREFRVARITAAGAVMDYPLPFVADTLVATPDGNLLAGEIYQVTPNGQVTMLPYISSPGGDEGINSVTVGSDGNLWFGAVTGDSSRAGYHGAVIRVGANRTGVRFSVPILPRRVITGGDGTIWIAEAGSGVLGRLTPTGGYTGYAVPDLMLGPSNGPANITGFAAGPDGNIWFTAATASASAAVRVEPGAAMPQPTATPDPRIPIMPSPVTPQATTPAAVSGSAGFTCGDLTMNAPVALGPFRDQQSAGEGIVPNFWGPAITYFQPDDYQTASGSPRVVQYFDKGRMELVGTSLTNGLLATELVTGKVQMADTTFVPRTASSIPIAGDPDGGGLSYRTLGGAAASLLAMTPAVRLGLPITTTVTAAGVVDPGMPGVYNTGPVTVGNYDFTTQHNVANAFVTFRTKVGAPAVGYAISEPFLTTVNVGGIAKQVLVQAFERRVLTYTAENPDPYKVEMGNIGQHYFRWRYCGV